MGYSIVLTGTRSGSLRVRRCAAAACRRSPWPCWEARPQAGQGLQRHTAKPGSIRMAPGGGLGDLLKGGLGGAGAGGLGSGFAPAGLGDLLKQFQGAGKGEVAESWVGKGENKPIGAIDLDKVLDGRADRLPDGAHRPRPRRTAGRAGRASCRNEPTLDQSRYPRTRPDWLSSTTMDDGRRAHAARPAAKPERHRSRRRPSLKERSMGFLDHRHRVRRRDRGPVVGARPQPAFRIPLDDRVGDRRRLRRHLPRAGCRLVPPGPGGRVHRGDGGQGSSCCSSEQGSLQRV